MGHCNLSCVMKDMCWCEWIALGAQIDVPLGDVTQLLAQRGYLGGTWCNHLGLSRLTCTNTSIDDPNCFKGMQHFVDIEVLLPSTLKFHNNNKLALDEIP